MGGSKGKKKKKGEIVLSKTTSKSFINGGEVTNSFDKKWSFTNNYGYSQRGRIWVKWDKENINLVVKKTSSQMVYCKVFIKDLHKSMWYIFVFGNNNTLERKKA